MKRIAIVGTGGHAKSVIDACEKQNEFAIIGLVDDYRETGELTLGHAVIGKISDIHDLIFDLIIEGWFIAVGDNYRRWEIFQKLEPFKLDYVNIIHPSALIGKGVVIGKGSVVLANGIINSGSTTGDFIIVNTKASLDHDNHLGDFASIVPNVTAGGNVKIAEFSAISIGVILRNGISVGAHSVIGAGSLVLKDVGDYKIAYGVPCKEIRTREKGEKYL